MKLVSYESLCDSFVYNLPELGALVAGISSIAFKVERSAAFVAKPVVAAPGKTKKCKSPPAKETKA